ncbi:FixH family protein [Pontivivens ytuae]|uniref:FixH family protein n=1 Tax=Pontivivens ytuae TaxID=2789856 RepID=A0A7S9QDA9_9RHOB|nr:FixH family protein [Pontivivens ytuae]QPH54187.1 FixH family protein [Pontivivens ytuae]
MIAHPITGRQVFFAIASAFTIIITVNMTLAVNAVRTFPGLEVKNSYVASQHFDADRAAQEALGWDVSARLVDGMIRLSILDADGAPVEPVSLDGVLGRATHVGEDVVPAFTFDGRHHVAPVDLGPGNWNLRMVAEAADGTQFRQRVIVLTGDAG